MYLVAIGWMYVVLMAAIVEALGSDGTALGAVFTFLLWGLLPLTIVMYLLRTPARHRERQARATAAAAAAAAADGSAPLDPDGGGHAAGEAIAPERKEP